MTTQVWQAERGRADGSPAPARAEGGGSVVYAEASDLGLAPGKWPQTLLLQQGDRVRTCNIAAIKRDDDGDIMWVTYLTLDGNTELRVFND